MSQPPPDERRIQQLNRREWRWSVAYLVLIGGVAATIGLGAPGWLIAGAVAVAVIVAGVVMIRDRITWDAILDYDERRFGLRTWKHKRKGNAEDYKGRAMNEVEERYLSGSERKGRSARRTCCSVTVG